MNSPTPSKGPELLAVIDLGSNTFHLVIARKGDNGFEVVHRNRVYARLARTGVGRISPKAFEDGLAVLLEFKQETSRFGVTKTKVVGTEMLRLAPNGLDFVKQVKVKTGFDVEIISGLKEAEYIYLGVKQLMPKSSYLVIDIGGGSVEFILVQDGQQKWLASFPIGIAVLYFGHPHQNPITKDELNHLMIFLAEKTTSLSDAIQDMPVDVLVGASGVFDTFFAVMGYGIDAEMDATVILSSLDVLIFSTIEDREKMTAIPRMRKKMIVVASILLKFVLELTSVKRIRYSPNSLKEGLLYSLIDAHQKIDVDEKTS